MIRTRLFLMLFFAFMSIVTQAQTTVISRSQKNTQTGTGVSVQKSREIEKTEKEKAELEKQIEEESLRLEKERKELEFRQNLQVRTREEAMDDSINREFEELETGVLVDLKDYFEDRWKKVYICKGFGITINDNTAEIRSSGRRSSARGKLILPKKARLEGKIYPVTSIASYAFNSESCSEVTTIVIHEGISKIGELAFPCCTKLKEIIVSPDNKFYESVDGILFDKHKTTLIRCPVMKSSVNIPESVRSIGENAFGNCKNLLTLTIPNSVLSIGKSAFDDCVNLKSIELPKYLSEIKSRMFMWCNSLSSITIPLGVESIEYDAFFGCKSLGEIEIPNSVTKLDGSIFGDCEQLSTVKIPSSLLDQLHGTTFSRCSQLKSLTVIYPDGSTKSISASKWKKLRR